MPLLANAGLPGTGVSVAVNHGIGRDGRADTETASEPIEPTLVLSPRTTLQTLKHDPATALIATLDFAGATGEELTGQRSHNRTTPSAWSLSLSDHGTLRIATGFPDEFGPFSTCHGSLSFGSILGSSRTRPRAQPPKPALPSGHTSARGPCRPIQLRAGS